MNRKEIIVSGPIALADYTPHARQQGLMILGARESDLYALICKTKEYPDFRAVVDDFPPHMRMPGKRYSPNESGLTWQDASNMPDSASLIYYRFYCGLSKVKLTEGQSLDDYVAEIAESASRFNRLVVKNPLFKTKEELTFRRASSGGVYLAAFSTTTYNTLNNYTVNPPLHQHWHTAEQVLAVARKI